MNQNLPRWHVPPVPQNWDTEADMSTWDWANVPARSPFILADGSGPATQQTAVRVCYNAQALYVRYDCDDHNIWATHTRRDEPIYDEEVVEIFIGLGEADPVRYFEFQLSPNGVLLDARVYNPTSQRSELELDISWNCPGVRWQAGRNDAANHWWGIIVIPWAPMTISSDRPPVWRANFYRIERPLEAAPEFSCWSPTMTDPADFHKPAYFGVLELK